jgi:hypothetical protein
LDGPNPADAVAGFEDIRGEACETQSVQGVDACEIGADDEGVEGVVWL